MKWALSLACAFFLGGTLGFLLGSRGDNAGPGEPASSVAEPLPQAPVETPGPPATSAGQPGEERATPVRATRSLAEAIESIPAPAVEAGTGVIQGRVVSDSGEPVAGVRIRADRAEEGRPGRGSNPQAGAEASLEEEVAAFVKRQREARAERRTAITDDTGAYRLAGLAEAAYRLEASAAAFSVDTAGWTPRSEARPGDTVDFVASRLIEVPLAVLLPDGTPSQEASIEAAEPGSSFSTVDWSSREPRIRLTPGDYVLTAVDRSNMNLRSQPVAVSLHSGNAIQPLTLQMKVRPGIEGQVHCPTGELPDSFGVYVSKVKPGSAPDPERLREEGKQAWLSADFRFAFRDLAPGTYLLGAGREDGRMAVVETVAVSDGGVVQDLTIPPLEPHEYLVLHVLGPGGEALHDVEVSGGSAVIHRPDGSYWILHHEGGLELEVPAEARKAASDIDVSSPRYGWKRVGFQMDGARELTVQFSEPGTLEVEVGGYAGSGFEDRLQLALNMGGHEGGPQDFLGSEVELDAGGRRTFGRLQPGIYQVILLVKQARHDFRPVQSIPVTIQSGRNQVSLPLPRLYSLSVVVDDPAGAENLMISSTSREGGVEHVAGGRVEPGGRVVFEALSAGQYRLQRWDAGLPEEMRVVIPGPLEVRFEPRPMNALLVTVDDPAGILAQAGLRTGDLIIGLNGKECSLRELQAQFWFSGKEASLLVLRGEERFEAKIDPQTMLKGEDPGGNLEPASR